MALYVLSILVLALLLAEVTSTFFYFPHPHPHHKLKSLHFTLFQHETINQTAFIIVNGTNGTDTDASPITMPFGTLFVFQDPMTVAANQSSKPAGTAQGASITASMDGLESITVAKITLHVKHHKGSISIVGGTHHIQPSDHPVVGGTGDFKFVQGYVTSAPFSFMNQTVTYKIKFHLYWPPYATKLKKKKKLLNPSGSL